MAALGLLERARELERLSGLADRAAAGRGSVALIEGPAGIGKTSLLASVAELGGARGLRVLFARAGLLERDLAWNLVRQLFGRLVGASERDRAELLAGAGALSAPALGLVGSAAVDEGGALYGLYWVASTLSERRPVLLTVDDAHWGDATSLRFLAYLGARIADLPALLAVTVRAGEPQDPYLQALGANPGVERVVLRELSPTATTELTSAVLGAGAAPEFCAACHAASSGNPFILHELLVQLARDRVEPIAERAGEVARVTPDTVKRSVLLRLSLLPETARELCTAVAVLGGEVQLRDAAAVANLEAPAAASAADALTRAGIFGSATPLRFVHPLVREVIYGELTAYERARRHREAAAVLARNGAEVQRIAIQLLQTEPLGDAWVVDRLRGAAQAALGQGARQPAVDFLRRALREPPDEHLRVATLRELAIAEALGESQAAIEHLEQARTATLDPRLRAQIGLELMVMLTRHGQIERTIDLAHAVLDEVRAETRQLQLAVVAVAATGAVLVPSLHPQMDFFLARIPADLQGETTEERSALSARVAAAITSGARMGEVANLAVRALADGKLLEELSSHELLYWNAASALVVADRFELARSAIEAAFEDARRRGSDVGFALSSCFRCLLNYRTGSVTEGTADGWQALRSAALDEPLIHAYAVAFLIDCLIERGEMSEALALATAPEFTGELPDLFVFHLLRVARARARIEAREFREGVRELLEVGAAMRLGGFSPGASPWRARASLGLSAVGERDRARALAEESLSLSQRTESRWAETLALQALAVADGERAGELLEQALDLSERHGFALEHARTLLLLGSLHRRQGRRSIAIELLRKALEHSTRCGALALEQRARGELQATGARARRRPLSGANALTGAERRVAQLAAEGMTNREIAQALFLSLRTVETHLTHTYQKLGIDTRGGLVFALAQPVTGA